MGGGEVRYPVEARCGLCNHGKATNPYVFPVTPHRTAGTFIR